MKNNNIVTLAVGSLMLYFAYNFWFGSGIFDGVYVPQPPEGFDNLEGALAANNPEALRSVGVSDLISQFLEIVATVVSTIGMVGIAISTKLIQFIAGSFDGFGLPQPTQQKQVESMGDEEFQTMLLVLGQAVLRKNAKLVIAAAEEMAGEEFLTPVVGEVELDTIQSTVAPIFPVSEDND